MPARTAVPSTACKPHNTKQFGACAGNVKHELPAHLRIGQRPSYRSPSDCKAPCTFPTTEKKGARQADECVAEKSSTQQRSCITLRTKELQAVRVRARPHRAGNRATSGARAESLPKTKLTVYINVGARQPALHPGCQRRSPGATHGT